MLGSKFSFLEQLECENDSLLSGETRHFIETTSRQDSVSSCQYVNIAPKATNFTNSFGSSLEETSLMETVDFMRSRLSLTSNVKDWRRDMKSAFAQNNGGAKNLQYYFMLAQLSQECYGLFSECLSKLESGDIKRNSKGRRLSSGTFSFLEGRNEADKRAVLNELVSGKKTLSEVRNEVAVRKLKRKSELCVDDLRKTNSSKRTGSVFAKSCTKCLLLESDLQKNCESLQRLSAENIGLKDRVKSMSLKMEEMRTEFEKRLEWDRKKNEEEIATWKGRFFSLHSREINNYSSEKKNKSKSSSVGLDTDDIVASSESEQEEIGYEHATNSTSDEAHDTSDESLDETEELGELDKIATGDLVALNLEGYNPPNLAQVVKVQKETISIVWLKGGYSKRWVKWPGWPVDCVAKESVVHFGFTLEKDKLSDETKKELRKRYAELYI